MLALFHWLALFSLCVPFAFKTVASLPGPSAHQDAEIRQRWSVPRRGSKGSPQPPASETPDKNRVPAPEKEMVFGNRGVP